MDRVLEIGSFAAGYAGRLFVQAGCDVVRVESPERHPSYVTDESMDLYLHPNKRRIRTNSLDLIKRLAEKASIVICEKENADGIVALGFDDWETPVKVAITPFGRTGPHRNWAASQNTILAMGGYTNLMGDPDRAPLTLPGHFVDFQTGGYAYTAASACRFADQANVIDVGMLETIMSLSQFTTVMWHCSGMVRSRHANDFWSVVPTNLFRCRDGWVYINIVPTFWDAFTTFLDSPELVLDERFMSNALRMQNRDALHEIIGEKMSQWSRAEIQQKAEMTRIPVGAALSFEEVLKDEHLEERAFWQTVVDEKGRVLRAPRVPFKIDDLRLDSMTIEKIEGS